MSLNLASPSDEQLSRLDSQLTKDPDEAIRSLTDQILEAHLAQHNEPGAQVEIDRGVFDVVKAYGKIIAPSVRSSFMRAFKAETNEIVGVVDGLITVASSNVERLWREVREAEDKEVAQQKVDEMMVHVREVEELSRKLVNSEYIEEDTKALYREGSENGLKPLSISQEDVEAMLDSKTMLLNLASPNDEQLAHLDSQLTDHPNEAIRSLTDQILEAHLAQHNEPGAQVEIDRGVFDVVKAYIRKINPLVRSSFLRIFKAKTNEIMEVVDDLITKASSNTERLWRQAKEAENRDDAQQKVDEMMVHVREVEELSRKLVNSEYIKEDTKALYREGSENGLKPLGISQEDVEAMLDSKEQI